MKAILRRHHAGTSVYDALMFVCPGCAEIMGGGDGLAALPVNAPDIGKPSWDFDGNTDAPTLSPSIMTRYNKPDGEKRCHSYVRAGVIEYLDDCDHSLAGQHVPLPDLPDWVTELR